MEDYKEKLRLAKEALDSGSYDKDTIEYIFPELRESEDERIKEDIISLVNEFWERIGSINPEYSSRSKMIAWLEKQVEQKPVDKVEPKFKVGDWIINSEGMLRHILAVDKTGYQTDYGWLTHDIYDNTYHLWTIQDAKEGDVLAVDNIIFIYKRTLASHIVSYCSLIGEKFDHFEYGRTCNEGNAYVHPATQEQRDLLFAKMKEAGYEWDAEKKELKKIEQKHVEFVPERNLKEKLYKLVFACAWDKVTCKVKGETQEEYAERYTNQILDTVRDWADDYMDNSIERQLRKSYEKGKKDAPKEQNPAWSEEDEKHCCWVIKHFEQDAELYANLIDWLKSVKERLKSMRPQSHKWYIKKGHWYMCIVDKPEYGWTKGKVYQSPEDNRIETDYKGDLTNWPDSEPWFRPATTNEIPNPQPHWKPSDAQMKALWDSIPENVKEISEREMLLDSLYQDLKRLREE